MRYLREVVKSVQESTETGCKSHVTYNEIDKVQENKKGVGRGRKEREK